MYRGGRGPRQTLILMKMWRCNRLTSIVCSTAKVTTMVHHVEMRLLILAMPRPLRKALGSRVSVAFMIKTRLKAHTSHNFVTTSQNGGKRRGRKHRKRFQLYGNITVSECCIQEVHIHARRAAVKNCIVAREALKADSARRGSSGSDGDTPPTE